MRRIIILITLYLALAGLIIFITTLVSDKHLNIWYLCCFLIGFFIADKLKYVAEFLDDIFN